MIHERVDEQSKWAVVANAIGTRSPTQCRSHAQKYFKKQKKAASKAKRRADLAAYNKAQDEAHNAAPGDA